MKIQPGNAQNIGRRSEQQDACGFSNLNDLAFRSRRGVLGVVADGMGGMAHGGAVSRMAVEAFLQGYARNNPELTIPQALRFAMSQANRSVLEFSSQVGLTGEMGTTLVAAVVHQHCLHWISTGDSRIYLFREGELVQVTVDHVFENELLARVSRGEMDQETAANHPERNSLTSYLGLEQVPYLDCSSRPMPLNESDWVILCSDGLFKTLAHEEIIESLKGEPQQACEDLVSKVMAKNRDEQDNITVLVFACGLDNRAQTQPGKTVAMKR